MDAYQEYVKTRREKEAENPEPASPTVVAEIDRDAAEGMILLIHEHLPKYSMKVQSLLVRAAKSLDKALTEQED